MIAVLLLIITLIHLDRFDLNSLFGVFWVGAYIVVPLLLAWAMLDERAARTGEDDAGAGDCRRCSAGCSSSRACDARRRRCCSCAPGTADDIWPWALRPLTSRAIGSFMFGVGLAALIAVRDDDPLSFRGAALAYAALGLLQLLAARPPQRGSRRPAARDGALRRLLGRSRVTGGYGSRAARASARS